MNWWAASGFSSSLHDRPVVRGQLALVELDVDRRALALCGDRLAADRASHGDLSVAQQLNRLGVRAVPFRDQRPQAVETPPPALDIERVELVHRHPVRQERDLELRADAAPEVEGPSAGEVLAVPDVGPGLGMLALWEDIGVIANVEGVDLVPDRIGMVQLAWDFRELRLIELRVVDRLQEIVVAKLRIAGMSVSITSQVTLPLSTIALILAFSGGASSRKRMPVSASKSLNITFRSASFQGPPQLTTTSSPLSALAGLTWKNGLTARPAPAALRKSRRLMLCRCLAIVYLPFVRRPPAVPAQVTWSRTTRRYPPGATATAL